jgi:hypothetical protein
MLQAKINNLGWFAFVSIWIRKEPVMFAYLINVGVSFHSANLIFLHLRLLRELSLQLIVESLHRDVVGEKIHAVIQFFNTESAQAYGAFVGAEGAAEDRQTL